MTAIKKAKTNLKYNLISDQNADSLGLLDDGTVLLATDNDGEFVLFDHYLTASIIDHEICDRFDDIARFHSIKGLPSKKILGANIDTAYLLSLKDNIVIQENKWDLMSEISWAACIKVESDLSGKVMAAVALDYLHIMLDDGTTKFLHDAENPFWRIAISADGRYLANGRNNGKVELREPQTLELIKEIEGLTHCVLAISFSPDGKYLVAVDDMVNCILYDMENDQVISVNIGWSKVTHLFWMSDSSGFIGVSLSLYINFFDLEDLLSGNNNKEPESYALTEYSPNYIQRSVLRDDENLFVFVEKNGILHIKLG